MAQSRRAHKSKLLNIRVIEGRINNSDRYSDQDALTSIFGDEHFQSHLNTSLKFVIYSGSCSLTWGSGF